MSLQINNAIIDACTQPPFVLLMEHAEWSREGSADVCAAYAASDVRNKARAVKKYLLPTGRLGMLDGSACALARHSSGSASSEARASQVCSAPKTTAGCTCVKPCPYSTAGFFKEGYGSVRPTFTSVLSRSPMLASPCTGRLRMMLNLFCDAVKLYSSSCNCREQAAATGHIREGPGRHVAVQPLQE